jgi:hypothetical protein
MSRRRVAAWKYFNGDTELDGVRWFSVGAGGKPAGNAVLYGDNNARFGTPIGVTFRDALETGAGSLKYSHLTAHRIDWLPVDREVRYLTKPDPHECDWRCVGAKPGGECWCACGGRNHGRKFACN